MTIEFLPRGEDGAPNFLKVIRTYRMLYNLSFEAARDLAIDVFEKHGWVHPFQKRK